MTSSPRPVDDARHRDRNGNQVAGRPASGGRIKIKFVASQRNSTIRVIAAQRVQAVERREVKPCVRVPRAGRPRWFLGEEDLTLAPPHPQARARLSADLCGVRAEPANGEGRRLERTRTVPAASTLKLGIALEVLSVLRS